MDNIEEYRMYLEKMVAVTKCKIKYLDARPDALMSELGHLYDRCEIYEKVQVKFNELFPVDSNGEG